MRLKQGIDIDITTRGKNCSIEMVSFPFYSHNGQPNRNLISSKKKSTFNLEDSNLNDSLLNFIIKNTNSNFETTYFTTAHSQAHSLLKNSVLNDKLEVSGLLEKNKTIPKAKRNYKFFDNKNSSESQNNVLIDIDLFSNKVFKSTELSISAYDNYNDLIKQKNPIFTSTEIKNKNINAQHDYLITSIIPHIKKFQEEGKNIQIHTTSKNLPFISSLNRYLKDNGFKPINFKVKKENKLNQIKSQNNIANKILEEYDNLLQLDDKYVIYTDGGILNEGKRNETVSSAFIFTEKSGESTGHDSFFNKHNKGVNYSELHAVKIALQFVIDKNKIDKPLYIVFDSDFASQKLQHIMTDNDVLLNNNKESQIIEDIKQLIKNNDINIADTLVLKSHQDFPQKHPVVYFNEKVDKLVKSEGYKKIKKYHL